MKKRPIYVQQREELTEDGDAIFWYVVKGRNGKTTSTSEMYPSRSNAIRAARRFIADITPVAVSFSYWTGLTPASLDAWAAPAPSARRRVTERIRFGSS